MNSLDCQTSDRFGISCWLLNFEGAQAEVDL